MAPYPLSVRVECDIMRRNDIGISSIIFGGGFASVPLQKSGEIHNLPVYLLLVDSSPVNAVEKLVLLAF